LALAPAALTKTAFLSSLTYDELGVVVGVLVLEEVNVGYTGIDRLHQPGLLELLQLNLPHLPDADHGERGEGEGGGDWCVGADQM
jgi:hypothetical protein